jgi:chain length determinant protein EpsF
MTFQQFILILRARRWVILGILVGVFGLVLAISLYLPKQYTATTTLVVDIKVTDPVLGTSGPSQIIPGYLATQIDIIGSERVALRVIEMTKLDQIPQFREEWRSGTDGEGGENAFRVWLATVLLKRLDVRPSASRDSNIISVGFTWPAASFAALMANKFAEAYVRINLDLKVGSARQYADWFKEQTGSQRDTLEKAQNRLSEYEQKNGVLAGDGRFDVENMRLAELNTQLSQAQGLGASARSREGQSASPESVPEVLANPVVAGLKSDLARTEADRSQLLERLGDKHPQILQLNEKIAELRRRVHEEADRVVRTMGTTTRVSDATIKELIARINEQQARVLELKKHRDQLAVLQRDVENAQRAYDLVTQRLAQTDIESKSQQTNIAVLTPAAVPIQHSSPKVFLNLVIAVFFGAMLGVGVALLLELFDQRVRGSGDLVQFEDVPFLGSVPGLSARSGVRIRHRLATA